MRLLHIPPRDLKDLDPDDIPGLLRHARALHARDRLERISDMRTAMAKTDEEVEAAKPSLIALAKKAAMGDKRLHANLLVRIL
jgi:hypothetical protein